MGWTTAHIYPQWPGLSGHFTNDNAHTFNSVYKWLLLHARLKHRMTVTRAKVRWEQVRGIHRKGAGSRWACPLEVATGSQPWSGGGEGVLVRVTMHVSEDGTPGRWQWDRYCLRPGWTGDHSADQPGGPWRAPGTGLCGEAERDARAEPTSPHSNFVMNSSGALPLWAPRPGLRAQALWAGPGWTQPAQQYPSQGPLEVLVVWP